MKGRELDIGIGVSGKKAVLNVIGGKPKQTPTITKKTPTPQPTKKTSLPKKQVPTKPIVQQQIKKEVQMVNPTAVEKVQPPAPVVVPPPAPKQPVISHITIKYSHYKQKFEAVDTYLPFPAIDQKYCISFVFKGNFVPKLKNPKTQEYAQKHKEGWKVQADEYLLEIDEDEVEEAKVERKAFKAQQQPGMKNKRGVDDLTSQLKKLTADELREKGDKYKQLIEQRDLQDILYK